MFEIQENENLGANIKVVGIADHGSVESIDRLRAKLQSAHEASELPELPSESTRKKLNDLLVRLRLGK